MTIKHRKIWIVSVITIICALATVFGTSQSAYAEQMIVLNCDSWVSLRSYPSTSAERIDKIYLGEPVESIGYSNGFNQVVYHGKEGWILTQYLGYGMPFTPTDRAGYERTIVNCSEWVSLRSYPSTSAPRLAKIPLGAWVESIGWENGFNQVIYNGQVGWVLTQYISN